MIQIGMADHSFKITSHYSMKAKSAILKYSQQVAKGLKRIK